MQLFLLGRSRLPDLVFPRKADCNIARALLKRTANAVVPHEIKVHNKH